MVQGPTLAPLARRLEGGENLEEAAEEAHARLAAAEPGLKVLEDPAMQSAPHPEVIRYLQQRHRQRARRWAAREEETHDDEPDGIEHEHFTIAPSHKAAAVDDERVEEYRRVRSAMIGAEEDKIRELRDEGAIADDVLRTIQRDLDLEAMLLETSEPVDRADTFE